MVSHCPMLWVGCSVLSMLLWALVFQSHHGSVRMSVKEAQWSLCPVRALIARTTSDQRLVLIPHVPCWNFVFSRFCGAWVVMGWMPYLGRPCNSRQLHGNWTLHCKLFITPEMVSIQNDLVWGEDHIWRDHVPVTSNKPFRLAVFNLAASKVDMIIIGGVSPFKLDSTGWAGHTWLKPDQVYSVTHLLLETLKGHSASSLWSGLWTYLSIYHWNCVSGKNTSESDCTAVGCCSHDALVTLQWPKVNKMVKHSNWCGIAWQTMTVTLSASRLWMEDIHDALRNTNWVLQTLL